MSRNALLRPSHLLPVAVLLSLAPGWVGAGGIVRGAGADPATQCTGARDAVRVLRDDFDGSALDAAHWLADANAGSVAVSGGRVRVSAGATTSFPLVTSVTPVIPATGAFSVRWRATFENLAVHGACTLVGSRGLPQDGGPNEADSVFHACQDSAVGYRVFVSTEAASVVPAFAMPGGTLAPHDVEVCWLEGRMEVWVDGARTFDAPRAASVPRPDALWFGNYARGGTGAPWNNFSIDVVEVVAFESDGTIFADGFEP